jgi:hypothetical protein
MFEMLRMLKPEAKVVIKMGFIKLLGFTFCRSAYGWTNRASIETRFNAAVEEARLIGTQNLHPRTVEKKLQNLQALKTAGRGGVEAWESDMAAKLVALEAVTPNAFVHRNLTNECVITDASVDGILAALQAAFDRGEIKKAPSRQGVSIAPIASRLKQD